MDSQPQHSLYNSLKVMGKKENFKIFNFIPLISAFILKKNINIKSTRL